MHLAETLESLIAGTDTCISRKDLEEKLKLGRPLRIKLGVDPTAPDIHFGHTVAMQKLRQFQDLGHQAVLIIGDFTAMIGDPTGKSTTRPPLTHEEVLTNAETYKEQAFKILDRDKTEVIYNGTWFNKMTYAEVLKLNTRATMQQMLQREDFRKRVDNAQEVRLHELQYPIMQGWDSVMVKADVELGGTDQRFNNLVGRDLQKQEGMEQQVVMLLPLLEGTDGVRKMSKSYGNYIGVSEPAGEMFGKLMSISDELMDRYYLLLLSEKRDTETHPMEAKKQLATRLTERFHTTAEATEARKTWEERFSNRNVEAGATEVETNTLPADLTVLSLASHLYNNAFNLKKSNGELRKQHIIPGAVQLNGEKLTDAQASITPEAGDVFRLSKKHTVKFI